MKEEHLRLFTPITEELPEGEYYANHNDYGICICTIKQDRVQINFPDGGQIYTGNIDKIVILDLSSLTTKSLAEQLARDAYNEGYECTASIEDFMKNDCERFITQNKGRL